MAAPAASAAAESIAAVAWIARSRCRVVATPLAVAVVPAAFAAAEAVAVPRSRTTAANWNELGSGR